MRLLLVLAAVLGPLQQIQPQTPSTPRDLRARVDDAAQDGVSTAELKALGDEALLLARGATSRAGFWNAISLAAKLCQAGPFVDAREIRARALELLVLEESDTMRWSALLTSRFLPAFASIPRREWSSELAAYDEALDSLCDRADSDHVRAELTYAKAFARVFINRRWEWLTDRERLGALAMLTTINERFGDLPVPGSAEPALDTVGRRALGHEYELTRLYFGAQAPTTSGVDLEGRPFDLADYEGKIVVIDFWTTFCQPCLALVPGVHELMQGFADEAVVYLGVNGDTDRLAGQATAQRVGMTWRNLWDGPRGVNGPAARAWNVPALGWPSVFVLDAAGRIRFKLRGQAQVEAELEGAIKELLAEGSEGVGGRGRDR